MIKTFASQSFSLPCGPPPPIPFSFFSNNFLRIIVQLRSNNGGRKFLNSNQMPTNFGSRRVPRYRDHPTHNMLTDTQRQGKFFVVVRWHPVLSWASPVVVVAVRGIYFFERVLLFVCIPCCWWWC